MKHEDVTELSDEALLSRSVTEPKLFEVLVSRYQDAFLRKAKGVLRSYEDSQDAVQEAFVKIYCAAPRFQKVEGASFKSWGYMILMNTSISLYRKKKRRGASESAFDPELSEVIADHTATAAAEQYTLSEQLLSGLVLLPDKLRSALTMHAIDGYSYQEIADREEVSLSVIKSRIHRAKEKLREFSAQLFPNLKI